MVSLSLIVLRSSNISQLKVFYETLGLAFKEEQHGNGSLHFSTQLAHGTILEIYPLKKGAVVDASLRLGFLVSDVDSIVAKIRQAGGVIASEPRQTEWGYSAVVKDVDGRAVELQLNCANFDQIENRQ